MASPQPSCSKAKLDSLFLQWFSLASTQQLVRDASNKDNGRTRDWRLSAGLFRGMGSAALSHTSGTATPAGFGAFR